MKYNYLELAERLKNAREEKGLSLRQLADKIGISHTEISRIENGMRANFSFLILIKLCKELDIDVMNLLDDIGLWEVDFDKLFYVMVKSKEEKIFKVHARSEGEAFRIAFDFVIENNLIELDENKANILVGVVENSEDFNQEIINYYDETGELPNKNEDNLEEDYDELETEIDDLKECESCRFCCPNCGHCTYGE